MTISYPKSTKSPKLVETIEFLRRKEKQVLAYHFVGIGGCGMSGLAQVLAQRGHTITGSDMQSSDVIERLGRRGIQVTIGHTASTFGPEVDCLVVSAAVKEDNPEWQLANSLKIPVYKYAEMLGQLSGQLETLAVAGTHGKSTTSGWLAYLLKEARLDPSYVIGAEVEQLGGGSGAGTGELMVVEACEYDRSFLNLKPKVAAILNIEADHLDYYRDVDEIVEAFGVFADKIDPKGLLVVNADDPHTDTLLADRRVPYETFGVKNNAHWQAENLRYVTGQGHFDLIYRGEKLGEVKLTLAGKHNVANALAVAAMAHASGANNKQICHGLSTFVGTGRRMSYKGEVHGVKILDDYAHHPTEISTTLEAIRAHYQPKRLWCVFQPHQLSRTRFFLSEFSLSFHEADIILLPDIYFVRESEQLKREVNAQQLVDKINQNGNEARYLGNFERILETLVNETEEGDVVVTMGAGDIWKVADELICRLG